MSSINAAGASPGSAGQGTQGSSSKKNRRPRERGKGPRFEGKCEDLKTSVYDVVSGKDTFVKTTREIAEYVTQGSKFKKQRKMILNLPDDITGEKWTTSQECVGTSRSYADVVRGTK